jgi:hypothetical protein
MLGAAERADDRLHVELGRCRRWLQHVTSSKTHLIILLPSADRKSVCHDASQSVVVTISDTCPCNYPQNYYR